MPDTQPNISSSASLIINKTSSLKPPLHTQNLHPPKDNDIDLVNEIMDVATEQQQESLDQHESRVENVEYDDDDDFMMRFVDGTCRGIFPTDEHDDIDKRSLCHLPSCHLSEKLDVLMVCFSLNCFAGLSNLTLPPILNFLYSIVDNHCRFCPFFMRSTLTREWTLYSSCQLVRI
jgi:hypothetical protein